MGRNTSPVTSPSTRHAVRRLATDGSGPRHLRRGLDPCRAAQTPQHARQQLYAVSRTRRTTAGCQRRPPWPSRRAVGVEGARDRRVRGSVGPHRRHPRAGGLGNRWWPAKADALLARTASASLVRSPMRRRSNSANVAKVWASSSPDGVVVSRSRSSRIRLQPRARLRSMRSAKSGRLRLSRSSFATTKAWARPPSTASSAAASPGRVGVGNSDSLRTGRVSGAESARSRRLSRSGSGRTRRRPLW
jgi:hypothetical protein